MRRSLTGAVLALGALLGTGPGVASAHPLLLQSAPQAGLVAPQPPDAIRLALSESGVARGSRITISGPRGARVPVSALSVSPDGRTFSVAPKRALASAVYRVRWAVMGNDGHLVRGTFDFGVAGGSGAAPPGAERLTGAAAGGRGSENAVADGIVTVLARWLGISAAAFVLGAFALVTLLARRAPGTRDGRAAVRAAAPLAWLLAGVAAAEGVLARVASGSGDDLDLGLLTGTPTGRADLLRLLVVALVPVGLALAGGRGRLRGAVHVSASVAVLLTYGVSGHVLADPGAWSVLGQAVHVLTASLWLGGVLAVLLLGTRGGVGVAPSARAFAPLAGGALGLAVLTGVLAAIREVDRWYFLRWSDYGRVVLVKAALVILVALAGAVAYRRARAPRATGPRPRLLRVEAVGVLAIVALAATMSGLAQGRGQPLPAERGSLFAGPAFATVLTADGGAPLTLAPARPGRNVVALSIPPERAAPSRVAVRLVRAGAPGAVRATLRRSGDGAWSAAVRVPTAGTWFGYVDVDGRRASAPVQLPVGVPRARGAEPRDVVAVADLSGPDADRCRAHVLGVGLALARVNGEGGIDGGRKVTSLVLDSGGDVRRAGRAMREALADGRPLAAVGGCGRGADRALAAARDAGVPVVAGDPTVGPIRGAGVFRTASDPYAQGLAFAQIVQQRVLPRAPVGVRTVRTLLAADAAGRRLADGLRAGLAGTGVRLDALAPGAFARRGLDGRDRLLRGTSALAVVLDAASSSAPDVAALTELGRRREGLVPAPILVSERVLSERVVRAAGSLGRIGALQGVTEVSPSTADGILYRQTVPVLYRGELASLDGLRGYVSGLALRDALRDGAGAAEVRQALHAPRVFTDALLAPWSPRQPGAGSPSVVAVQPQFLSPTLVPPAAGGTPRGAAYFPDGTWTVTSGPLGVTRQTGGAPAL